MMRLLLLLLLASSLLATAHAQSPADVPAPDAPVAIVIHGGAGTILPENMTAETEAAYRAALEEALRAGHTVLTRGGTSLDAVEATIQVMEASPLFNAGRGAVFTSEGTVELDASIMDGATLAAGAVAGVKQVESPIRLARLVMQESPHVLMVGDGAEAFAREQGLPLVDNATFHTDRRRRQLEQVQAEERTQTGAVIRTSEDAFSDPLDRKHGTVGAVALDRYGNLAAATSTGGMTNKRFGRVGDSPIIGAGTYADNETCAVSATGHGEYFIRGVIAHDIAAMMRYTDLGVVEAANAVIHGKLTERGGTGGVIAMDRAGRIAMPFNTAGMYRGYIGTDGELVVRIFRD